MTEKDLKLLEKRVEVYELEYYVQHALSELNSKRNDGWVDEHYRKELIECGKIIDEHLENLNKQIDMFEETSNYEKEKLSLLRKRIDEVYSS